MKRITIDLTPKELDALLNHFEQIAAHADEMAGGVGDPEAEAEWLLERDWALKMWHLFDVSGRVGRDLP